MFQICCKGGFVESGLFFFFFFYKVVPNQLKVMERFPSEATLLIRSLGHVNAVSLPPSPLSFSNKSTNAMTTESADKCTVFDLLLSSLIYLSDISRFFWAKTVLESLTEPVFID